MRRSDDEALVDAAVGLDGHVACAAVVQIVAVVFAAAGVALWRIEARVD